MMKSTISTLLLPWWSLLGLILLLSFYPVEGRELQSNQTVFVPGLFDQTNFDFGEEVSRGVNRGGCRIDWCRSRIRGCLVSDRQGQA